MSTAPPVRPPPHPPGWATGPFVEPTLPVVRAGDLRLSEVLGALSHALDITEGQPAGHGMRCCWIGCAVGRAAGLGEHELSDLFYTLLLKDPGCSSNAARICALYPTDDRTFKQDYKVVGDSLPQALRFVLEHTGLGERFRAVLDIVRNGGEIAREQIETRCQHGADIARHMRFSDSVARGIQYLDEHRDGRGRPLGLKGAAIAPHARIALLAQVVDVFHRSGGVAAARREVRRRLVRPAHRGGLRRRRAAPAFWDELAAADLEARVLAGAGRTGRGAGRARSRRHRSRLRRRDRRQEPVQGAATASAWRCTPT